MNLQTGLGEWQLNSRAGDHKLFVVSDGSHMKVVLLVNFEILFVWKINHKPHIRIARTDTCNSRDRKG